MKIQKFSGVIHEIKETQEPHDESAGGTGSSGSEKQAAVANEDKIKQQQEELAQKLDTNPYSLLHVLHRRGKSTANRFTPVRKGYEQFVAEGHLEADPEAHLYIYEQQWDGHVFMGMLGLISLEDYRAGQIIKHENTIAKRPPD